MNNARRKQLNELSNRAGELSAMLEDLKDRLEEIKNDEEEALENMPESLRDSEKGQMSQEAIDNLECFGDMDEVRDYITSACE